MKNSFIAVAVLAFAAFVAIAESAHAQSEPPLPPDSHYVLQDGKWLLVPIHPGSAAASAERGTQQDAQSCDMQRPDDEGAYAVTHNGCTYWCKTGWFASNPPFCSGPAVVYSYGGYGYPYYRPYYGQSFMFGFSRGFGGTNFGGHHGGWHR